MLLLAFNVQIVFVPILLVRLLLILSSSADVHNSVNLLFQNNIVVQYRKVHVDHCIQR